MPAYKKISERKIKYSDAPSGYINITKWVPPFEIVKEGFGYQGVLAEDTKTGQLQCHICGKWYEQLPTHLLFKHKMTSAQYRKKFGLLTSTALKSKAIRMAHSKNIERLQKEGRMQIGNSNGYGFKKKNKESANRKGISKARESQNKYGVCDLQIMDRIISLSKKLGKTPTLTDIKKEYGGGIIAIMRLRYGSYITYCRQFLKMEPGLSNFNPRPKKEWQNSLIEKGIKILRKERNLKIKMLPVKESRYVYKYFKNFKEYKKIVLSKYENTAF